MNDMRDRIRDAAGAVGDTVRQHDLRPFTPRPTGRRFHLLVPLASAAAVLLVAATVVGVRATTADDPAPRVGAAPVAADFYLHVKENSVDVRSVATGKKVSTVAKRDGGKKSSYVVAGAAPGNRVFFVSTYTDSCKPKVYRLEIDDRGRQVSFGQTAIRLPAGTMPTGIDATDGGTQVAISLQGCRGKPKTPLVLADPETGKVRAWGKASEGWGVSISGDGATMLLGTRDGIGPGSPPTRYWLVDPAKPGGPITGQPLDLPADYDGVKGTVTDLAVSADGQSLVGAVTGRSINADAHNDTTPPEKFKRYGLVEYSLTGEPRRVLYRWRTATGSIHIFGDSGNARWLVSLTDADMPNDIGWVGKGEFRPLPPKSNDEEWFVW